MLKNFSCWSQEDVFKVINPDADGLPDHVFAAVHTDSPIALLTPPGVQPTVETSQDFLGKFLERNDHVLVPFVGESGTGKSHLIRWLKVCIPPTEGREVIFVPKAQTNLRDILRQLASRLPKKERIEFEKELRGTGDALEEEIPQRTAVLNELHTALQNDKGDSHSVNSEMESYLLKGLIAIFNDHHLRSSHFLKNNHFAAEMASHIFSRPKEYKPTESRREFTRNDLPLSVIDARDSGKAARDFLQDLLGLREYQPIAAEIVNRHVDHVISKCLNVTGDRLIELMLSIRRRLKEEGKELVLLIEDFARLQGFDHALLQSLIEQREDLCVLRTAFACTTGFYEKVADTVRTRLSFVVDMNEAVSNGTFTGPDLISLTAKYLNALRWGESKLKKFYSELDASDELFYIANRCTNCQEREFCHTVFGEVDGVGLYPFTRNAINCMVNRIDDDTLKHFPRAFQKAILQPVVKLGKLIEQGEFPNDSLFSTLGGTQSLSLRERQRLQAADSKHWRRREVLLLLWHGTESAINLPENIQLAFGLEKLAHLPTPDDVPTPPPGPENLPPDEPYHNPKIAELERWSKGECKLSQETANAIRPLLFNAIENFIDWDDIGIAKTHIVGRLKKFQGASIYFQNQTTAQNKKSVSLTIPNEWDDEQERYQTVMAIQMLLEWQYYGDWNFEREDEKVACLIERLHHWSAKVIKQLHASGTVGDSIHDADIAFSIRVALNLLTNCYVSANSDIEVIACGLDKLGGSFDYASPKLKKIVSQAMEEDESLMNEIVARYSSTKGSNIGKYIETNKFISVIRELRSNGFMPIVPPDNLPIKKSKFVKLANSLSDRLPSAINEEVALRREWLNEVDNCFGQDATKEQILSKVQNLIDALGKIGFANRRILIANHEFSTCSFDWTKESIRKLSEEDGVAHQHLASPVGATMEATRSLIEELQSTLDEVEGKVTSMLINAGIDPDDEGHHLNKIKQFFEEILDSISEENG